MKKFWILALLLQSALPPTYLLYDSKPVQASQVQAAKDNSDLKYTVPEKGYIKKLSNYEGTKTDDSQKKSRSKEQDQPAASKDQNDSMDQAVLKTPVLSDPGDSESISNADSVSKKGKELAQKQRTAQTRLSCCQSILYNIRKKQEANQNQINSLEKTKNWLQNKTESELTDSQSSKKDLQKQADLEYSGESLFKLHGKIQRLSQHQNLLMQAYALYSRLVVEMEALIQVLEQQQDDLRQKSGLPEFKEGGKFNPDALIPENAKIPDYKLPENGMAAKKENEKGANRSLESHGDNPDDLEVKEKSEPSRASSIGPTSLPNHKKRAKEGQEEAGHQAQDTQKKEEDQKEIGQKDAGSNTGGLKRGTSFVKACPAPGLDVSDLDLNLASGSVILPVNGVVSAGTWAYYGGGMHLGLDLAAPLYSALRAPANGVILYADHPVDSNCGYLGNFCGWPYGGGNTICMLSMVGDQLFAFTFCHLSNIFYVSPGQQVMQGEVLALTGNSGNSTGPHTHVEVFALSCTFQEAVTYFSYGADFAFGCGWDTPATCSAYGCRIRPESIFF